MLTALVVIFVAVYAAIALEHPIKVNKSASALVGAGLLWTVYALSAGDPSMVSRQLGESVMTTAQIVFFLMGAMTIVEVVDAHNGFDVISPGESGHRSCPRCCGWWPASPSSSAPFSTI